MPDIAGIRSALHYLDVRPWWEANEALGVARPGQSDPADAFRSYLAQVEQRRDALSRADQEKYERPFTLIAPWVSGFNTYSRSFNPFATMGFDQRNVDIAIIAGTTRIEMELVQGNYGTEAIRNTLGRCAECQPPTIAKYAGVDYFAWGEDSRGHLSDRFAAPLFDANGVGGRVAVLDGLLFRTLTTERMQMMLDVAMGNARSLAEDADYALAARAFDAVGGYAGVFTNSSFDVDTVVQSTQRLSAGTTGRPITQNEFEAELRSAPLLVPFMVAASGWAVKSTESRAEAAIVLVHRSEVDAQENASRLMARFTDGVSPADGLPWSNSFSGIEISVNGRVLVAILEPREIGITNLIMQLPEKDPIIVYESVSSPGF